MRSPPWRASDPSAARANTIRRAVNPSPPTILKDPPCAGFLIWIAEVADLNPVRAAPRLRGELDAQPALAGERPERSEGKHHQTRSQSLSPNHIKRPALCGFFNMDSGVCGFEPGSNRAALARRARCAARPGGRATRA